MFSKRFSMLTPYTPGEQPKDQNYVKLNTNENPYPPAPAVQNILSSFEADELRLYPDPGSSELRQAVAEAEGVRPEQVFVSNGSDEALSFCFFTFFDGSRSSVLFPRYTYSFYPVYSAFYGIPYKTVPVQRNFSLDFGYLRENIGSSTGFILPNPNAPTGVFEEVADIAEICSLAGNAEGPGADTAVIIDEAYIDFGGESSASLLDEFHNLLIVKTFSKGYSLAGIRLGYVLGQEELISALFTVKDSFNSYPLDRLTQKIGIAALSSRSYYRSINRRIMNTREKFSAALQKLGWEVVPGKANFVFARKPKTAGQMVFEALKQRNFLVRHFSVPGIDEYVRITIGREEDMDALLSACSESF
jgi:histidinol-phosphate aminotransferase